MNNYPICPHCYTRDKRVKEGKNELRKCFWCKEKYQTKNVKIVKYQVDIRSGSNRK